MPKHETTPCPACGGSGQINFFQGVSRFLLTVEDCPQCAGLGVIATEPDKTKRPTEEERRDTGRGDQEG